MIRIGQWVVVGVLGWTLGRSDGERHDRAPRANSPMSQLARCTDALRASVRREYPDWAPESGLQRMTVHRLLSEVMDYHEISQRALEHTWDRLSQGEREGFVADLGALIERRYVVQERSIGPDLRVDFQREVVTDHGTASVFGTIARRSKGRDQRAAVEYRLLWRNGRWVVYDVVTDGDSMLENYRNEFDRIIARETFAGLKKRMKRAEVATDDR